MPPATKIALAVLIAACIMRAFFGDPPTRRHDRLAPAAAAMGFTHYVGAATAAWLGQGTVASMLVGTGVLWLCLAVWLARGRDDGWGRADDPPPDPPVDWEEFDRERARWHAPRPRTPVA